MIRQYPERPTYTETVVAAGAARMADLDFWFRQRVTEVMRAHEAELNRDASEKAWKRERLPHHSRAPEPSYVRPVKAPRPCEVISFTFSKEAGGETWERCLGVFPDGRNCAYCTGRLEGNITRHRPEDIGANVVDEVEVPAMRELLEPEPERIAGVDEPEVEVVEAEDSDGSVATVERGELEETAEGIVGNEDSFAAHAAGLHAERIGHQSTRFFVPRRLAVKIRSTFTSRTMADGGSNSASTRSRSS